MRSLYESLLDDEDELVNDTTGGKFLIQKWVDDHLSKYKGRITVNKKLEVNIKGVEVLDVSGPFPEWLKFGPGCNAGEIAFHDCSENEIEKVLDNITVKNISIDGEFRGKDLSVFNKKLKSLDSFQIDDRYYSNSHKLNLHEVKLDFPVKIFACRAKLDNLKSVDISKVTDQVLWSKFTMHDLSGFPKKLETAYINLDPSNTGLKTIKDLESVSNKLTLVTPRSTSKKFYYYDISNLLKIDLNGVQVGDQFIFNNVYVPSHLLRSDRRGDLEAWVTFMMVNKCHDLDLFDEYVKKYKGKEVKFDDMQPGHNYIIVDLESKYLTGIDDMHRFVWDTNYYSALSEKNGNYKSSIVTDYDNPFGPDMDLPRIERFKKNYKSYYDNNKHKIIECSKEMEPLIYMDWRYK